MTLIAVVAGVAPDERGEEILRALCARLAAPAPGAALSADEFRRSGLSAVKMWAPHAASRGFARDAATGSALAVVGNPARRGMETTGPEGLAGALLSEYLRSGRGAITSLDAPFNVIILDGRDDSLHAVTDRAGVQHLYRYDAGGGIVLSTSSLAIASVLPVTLDREAVAAYLQCADLMGCRTLLREITKVPAATWLTLRGGVASQERYWRPGEIASGRDAREWARDLADAGREALDAALSGGVETTVELTGGLDSRFNLASALATGRPFKAFTIAGVKPAEMAIVERLAAARGFGRFAAEPLAELADTFEADFRTIHRLTDGQTDCLNVIASPAANRQAAARRLQSVTGIGGELFRGAYYRSAPLLGSTIDIDRFIDWELGLNSGFRPSLLAADAAAARAALRSLIGGYFADAGGAPERKLDWFFLFGATEGASGRSFTFNNFFYRQCAPFLSNRMLDLAFEMPPALKRRSRVVREAMLLLDPVLADIPLATGLPARPLRAADAGRLVLAAGAFGVRVARKVRAKFAAAPYSAGVGESLNSLVASKLAAMAGKLLDYDNMASASLYDPVRFRAFVRRNVGETGEAGETGETGEAGFPGRTQIGLMLSLELTCECVGQNLKFS